MGAFPQYLVMGMTPEQYWDEDPFLAVAYRKAYRLKRKAENEQAWLQGVYFCEALNVCLSNAFSEKGKKKQNYFEKPIDILPLTPAEQKQREREEREKMQLAMEEIIRMQRQRKHQKGD